MALRKKKKDSAARAASGSSRARVMSRQSEIARPRRALALFLLILLAVVAAIAFTGSRSFGPKLGIDLQGGTRVTLVPQGASPTTEQLSQARRILEGRVNGMGVSGAEVVVDGSNLVITVPGEDAAGARSLGKTSQMFFRPVENPTGVSPALPAAVQEMANRWVSNGVMSVEAANEKLAAARSGLEGIPGAKVPRQFTVSAKAPAAPKDSVQDQKRRDKQIQVLKADRQSTDPVTQAAATVLLECSDTDALAGADDPAKPLVSCSGESPLVLGPAPLLSNQEGANKGRRLTGELIDTDSPITGGLDPNSAQMAISFRFKTGNANPGGETWSKFGTEMLGRQVAITLDSRVISAPVIQGVTGPGEATQITGDFTEEEARDLANNLRYGALPLSFVGENGEPGGTTTTISPSLGAAALEAGILAGLVGLVLISIYALIYYRGLGFIAILSLVASFLLVYGFIVLLGRWIGYSLDLSGIAGLIIGLGTTADSFVIYFERIKDEIKEGATFRSAVPRAWDRAKSTIITGNIVSLIAAIILYFLAIGEVKGFAFTLGLTTVFDIVVAFLVTAPLLILLSRRRFAANPKLNGLGEAMSHARALRAAEASDEGTAAGTSTAVAARKEGFFRKIYNGSGAFNIVANRRRWYLAMAALVLLCLAAIGIRGFSLGIDFEGGTRMTMPPSNNATETSVARVFEDATGVAAQSTQTVGSGNARSIEITAPRLSEEQIQQARAALFREYQPRNLAGEVSQDAISDSTVSESWGDAITKRMLIALAVFLIVVFLYIAVRLERDMAAAAIICLLIDLMVVSGLYALIGFEVSPATVIGLLTILAYSLYDTVVVFDKVKENTAGLFGSLRATYAERVNLAINQTIMRSINTSIFSVVPITALLVVAVGLMGVGTLKDLALVQFIGVIAGTFSSIFFAAPLLVTFKMRQEKYRAHTARVAAARESEPAIVGEDAVSAGQSAGAAMSGSVGDLLIDDRHDAGSRNVFFDSGTGATRLGGSHRPISDDSGDFSDQPGLGNHGPGQTWRPGQN